MKKIWICFRLKTDELGYVKDEIKPIKIFESKKLAENYCHWKNKDFDPTTQTIVWCRSYLVDELDYGKIPF